MLAALPCKAFFIEFAFWSFKITSRSKCVCVCVCGHASRRVRVCVYCWLSFVSPSCLVMNPCRVYPTQ